MTNLENDYLQITLLKELKFVNKDGEEEIITPLTVKKYKEYEKEKNREVIAEFIYSRLKNRYIKPFCFKDSNFKKNYKNGFVMMASASLLIETYMSFKRGINQYSKQEANDGNTCKELFIGFFEENPEFKEFKKISIDFYFNLRCSLLHQGETSNGWKIIRGGNMLDSKKRTINATRFLHTLDDVLKRYKNELKNKDWDSDVWKKARSKMDYIIGNCKRWQPNR